MGVIFISAIFHNVSSYCIYLLFQELCVRALAWPLFCKRHMMCNMLPETRPIVTCDAVYHTIARWASETFPKRYFVQFIDWLLLIFVNLVSSDDNIFAPVRITGNSLYVTCMCSLQNRVQYLVREELNTFIVNN